ncbi:MAG: UDP-N-acetylmuramoyl-L-alanine--D-glutamate ligase [Caldilineaceae bacterium]|nr:UDP-N-acetylmuramoyl-L-alanine--D-glutamate ligase [Caldilineaceae bacterium]
MASEGSAFDFTNRKVVILGLARQGLALARFFVQAGAQTVISDAAPATKLTQELTQLGQLPVELVLGAHPLSLLDGCDLLCLSGGVPPQLELVQTAIARGIPLSNDSLLTFQLARSRGLGPLIALTGSSGKTTTTTLVGLMLQATQATNSSTREQAYGKSVHVGGNIGTPLLDRLDTIQPGEPIVLELSSFQLELFDPQIAWGELSNIGPDVAAILNITPNHLDRHPDMAAYANAKLNLLRHLPANAQVVISADDPVCQRLYGGEQTLPNHALPAAWHLDELLTTMQNKLQAWGIQTIPFSRQQLLSTGAWLADQQLVYAGQPLCPRSAVLLRGEHNISNLLAAAVISGAVGAEPAAMRSVATTFRGVRHRLEIVTSEQQVTWINDSIATAPERAMAALRSFTAGEQTLILLAGGKDKNLPWDSFADEVIGRVNYVIGFGHAGSMIIEKIQERAQYTKRRAPNCAFVQRLDEAVALAARVAGLTPATTKIDLNGQGEHSHPALPTVVLLSPGGTSYDAYRDFEERGEHFRRLVASWTTAQPTLPLDPSEASPINESPVE